MLKLLIVFIYTFNLHAQLAGVPETSTTLPCINQKGEMDFNCQCRKQKKCMRPLEKSDKAGLVKMNKEVKGGYVMKFFKEGIPAYKQYGKILNGQFDMSKFDTDKMRKMNEKLEKINAKLKTKVEARYKALGIKPHKIDDRIKAMDKKFEQRLGKENLEDIKNGKIKLNIPALIESNGANIASNQTQSSPNNSNKKNVVKKPEDNKEKEIKSMLKLEKRRPGRFKDFDEEKAIMLSQKKFKFDTIIKDPKRNIFFYITKAYRGQIKNLDKKAMKNFYFDDRNELIQNNLDIGYNQSVNNSLLD